MHNLRASYDKILEVLYQIEPKSNFLVQIRSPKTDCNEFNSRRGIDSEHQLFRVLPKSLSCKIER